MFAEVRPPAEIRMQAEIRMPAEIRHGALGCAQSGGERRGWLGPAALARSIGRTGLFVALLLAATVQGMVLHWIGQLEPGSQGAVFIHRWCRRFLRAIGIACTVEGKPLGRRAAAGKFEAVIANHLSYLDIVVLAAVQPFVMVAKTEVRGWPLLGWLTAQAGTVYVTRGQGPASYPAVNAAMANAFRSGLPVLFFPEGTTTDGSAVLPLRRGLFHSVLRDRVHVRAAALRYRLEDDHGGTASVANDVCWWGDADFVPHLFRLLGLGKIRAQVRFGPEVRGADRFELARNGHAALAELYESLAPVAAEGELRETEQLLAAAQ